MPGSAPAGEPVVSLRTLPAWESHTSRKLNTTLPAPAAHLGDPEGIKDGHITDPGGLRCLQQEVSFRPRDVWRSWASRMGSPGWGMVAPRQVAAGHLVVAFV